MVTEFKGVKNMATDSEYIKFVCEQLDKNLDIRYRKMFGDYMIYINDKPILLVCDNTVYVKKVPQLSDIMADAQSAPPYPGAKEWYVLDIENPTLTSTAIQILEPLTPIPHKKKKPKT